MAAHQRRRLVAVAGGSRGGVDAIVGLAQPLIEALDQIAGGPGQLAI
jgi:hypothetical protein